LTKIVHHIAYYLFVAIISIPLLFELFGDAKSVEPLNGVYTQPKEKTFSFESWTDRTFQDNKDSTFKYNLALRPTLIRLYNQIDYSVFDKTNMGDLLIGKDDYMFSLGWTKARAGEVSLNDSLMDEVARKLKLVEDSMKANNQFFMFLIPPSKEELFSHFLPSEYEKEGAINDYKILLSKLDKYNVSYTDLKPYYQKLMKEKEHPVYSKTSVHWTMYGAHFTTLMLLDSMNTFFNGTMPQLKVTGFDYSLFKENDGDHEKTLNLFTRIDDGAFAYPKYEIIEPKGTVFKPRVLTLGDSYYWGILGSWQLTHIFSKESKYLYYYSTVYPNFDAPSYPISDLNMAKEFKQANAFIIINSCHNLNNFPYGLEKDLDAILKSYEK
jgi:hypothetical protein